MRCIELHIIAVIVLTLASCGRNENDGAKKEGNKVSIESNNGSKDNFTYREIMDTIDVIDSREFWDCVYGNWVLTSIANVGGSLFEEQKIKDQIGKLLLIEENKFSVDLLGDQYTLNSPNYEIEAIDNDSGPLLKGTSIFYGYQMCRDSVYHVIVSEKQEPHIYLELISCDEICTYYDGRIYFYERNNAVPNKKQTPLKQAFIPNVMQRVKDQHLSTFGCFQLIGTTL